MLQLSVVMATYFRAGMLGDVLESFKHQTLPADEYELIVVNDGSTDDTESVVSQFTDTLPMRYVYQPNGGISAARNHGLALARSPLVLFLVDDNILDPEIFRVHVDAHREYPDETVSILGFERVHPDIASDPLMHFVTDVGGYLFNYHNVPENTFLGYDMFWGGRTSSKRDFLLQSGGFNPVFTYGCDDIELGYRLAKYGLKVIYKPQALTTTIRKIDFEGFCWRLRRQGYSQYIFSRMWPDAEIQRWCEIPEYRKEWPAIEPRYAEIIDRARALDKWAHETLCLGLECDQITINALHEAYHLATKASKLAGIAEAERKW